MRPWSSEENAALTASYPAGGMAAALKVLPGRTESAIQNRVAALGLLRGRPDAWTESDVATLRVTYASGGRAAAAIALPHRSPEAIAAKASALGITTQRGRPPKSKPEPKPAAPVVQRTLAPAPPRIIVRDGACDHGDREHIRKRLAFVFMDLAREIGRTPAEVRRAVVDMALDGFVERRLSAIDRESVYGSASEGAS